MFSYVHLEVMTVLDEFVAYLISFPSSLWPFRWCVHGAVVLAIDRTSDWYHCAIARFTYTQLRTPCKLNIDVCGLLFFCGI